MARSVIVVMNGKGVRELLRSSDVAKILRGHADRIAGRAGPGHEVEVDVGRNRARAVVITATPDAIRSEATHRTLTRAVG